MNEKQLKHISKFMSLVLRHDPAKAGLQLDSAGWVGVEQLLTALQRHGMPMTRDELSYLIANNDKKRFALSEDGLRIRASQGHSIAVELNYEPSVPPATLFHGTAQRNLDSIRRQGLLKRQRHHVHLSAERQTALSVGQRYGRPVLLLVDTAAMQRDGFQFFRSDNGVWLTDAVAPQYLTPEKE